VFDAGDDDAWHRYLTEYGFAVIHVLDDEQLVASEEIFWREMSESRGWDEREPRTWRMSEKMQTLASDRNDCGHVRGFDFSEFQFTLLKNANVRHVYASLSRRHSSQSAVDH